MAQRPIDGESPRAQYASFAYNSRGRLFVEPPSPTRNLFQRDRDRIVHSTAFRRLAQKTQVFAPIETTSYGGDHFRTRLTHTIEVAQIARALARGLGLDDDLAEALALCHDLGHTPFGHVGEDVLDALMAAYGGFDHNAQALRLVTRLERRYAGFDGLNLAWETLEGLVKHNGPLMATDGAPTPRYAAKGVARPILEFDAIMPLDLASYASAEAQAAAIADDIAYNAHDIDDGLRAGLYELYDMREAVPYIDCLAREIEEAYGALERPRMIHELVRRVITRFVEDALTESQKRFYARQPRSASDVRNAGKTLVALSPAMAEADRAIKTYLMKAMYRHPAIMRVRAKAAEIISGLFQVFLADRKTMPLEWSANAAAALNDTARARVVADYIAGMTDRYALHEYRRLIDPHMDLD